MADDDHIYANIVEMRQSDERTGTKRRNPLYNSHEIAQDNTYDDPEETKNPQLNNGVTFSVNAAYDDQEEYAEIPDAAYQGHTGSVGGQYEVCSDVRPTAPPRPQPQSLPSSPEEGSSRHEDSEKALCTRCACSVMVAVLFVACVAAIVVLGYMVHLSKKETEELRISCTTKIDNLRYWTEREMKDLKQSSDALRSLKRDVISHSNQIKSITTDTVSLKRTVGLHGERLQTINSNVATLTSVVDQHTEQLKYSGLNVSERITANEKIIEHLSTIPSLMVSFPTKPTIARFEKPTIGKNANGSPYWYGIIEVMHRNTWGTVCSDGFNEASARVLCRMLGFAHGVYEDNAYKQNMVPSVNIWLDNVVCIGNETNIDECTHNGWGVHNCNHNRDVGIRCSNQESIVRFPSAVSTSLMIQGHIEILYKNIWGTICDDSFKEANAGVLCRSAGFRSGLYSNNKYKQTSVRKASKIWLDDVICVGSEGWVGECPHRGWGSHNCGHNEDVGVLCYKEATAGRDDPSSILAQHFYVNLNATFIGHEEASGGLVRQRSYSKSSNSVETCIEFCNSYFHNVYVSIQVDRNPIACTCHLNPTGFHYSVNRFLYKVG